MYILVFELIAAVGGIGKLLGQIIAYKDLAALLAVSIIISVIIYVTNHIIKYFSGRFIRWNSK